MVTPKDKNVTEGNKDCVECQIFGKVGAHACIIEHAYPRAHIFLLCGPPPMNPACIIEHSYPRAHLFLLCGAPPMNPSRAFALGHFRTLTDVMKMPQHAASEMKFAWTRCHSVGCVCQQAC